MGVVTRGRALETPDEVAERLGVSKAWIYAKSREWVRTRGRRGIPTVVLGRHYRYNAERVDEWTRQLETGEAEA